MASKERTLQQQKKLHIEIVGQMLTLATSGFGLVAALAWNTVIQEFVKEYVTTWLPNQSGLISLLLYAIIVTVFAVLVTIQLSKLKERVER
ncbi:MAG: hypothetical protein HYT10_02505 [Candidatus Levybacteria bacterium]|nr:hypothetical protein [Candidatus Levybacteria bacterium]